MGMIIAAIVALLVSSATAAAAGRAARIAAPWQRAMRGMAVWLGLAAGLLTLWLTGAATSLVLILLGTVLVVGLLDGLLAHAGIHVVWRWAAQVLTLGTVMVYEWQRGDIFLTAAVVATAAGVLVLTATGFATRAAHTSQAARTPALLTLLGAAYLFLVAWGLPNPGLAASVTLIAAAIVPMVVLPTAARDDGRLLGSVLGAAAWATGFQAWLANASIEIVIAPLAVVLADVTWTLLRRLATRAGRARLAAASGWWKAIDAWAQPADDLVTQRAAASSPRLAAGWPLAASLVCSLVSLATWWAQTRQVVAAAMLAGVAVLWLAGAVWLINRGARTQTVPPLSAPP